MNYLGVFRVIISIISTGLTTEPQDGFLTDFSCILVCF